jgi:RNA polymerase sigma-70 factor (ECF subfamily)
MPSDTDLSDEVIDRLRGGDDGELAEQFSRFRKRLKRMVEFRMDSRLRGRVDPSDVLQDAYLAARKRLKNFLDHPEVSLFVWLRSVTIQRLIDTHRRHLITKRRDVAREVRFEAVGLNASTSASMAEWLVGHLTSPSQLVQRAELLEQLKQTLDGMEPIDREILVLRHFEELTNSEIAEVLQISPAAASNRYVRALTRLHTRLAEVPGSLTQRSDRSIQSNRESENPDV